MTDTTARLAPDHTVWSVWMEDSDSWDGVALYADEQTALAHAAADWISSEYGQPDPDDPGQTTHALTWTKPYSQWELADEGCDTGIRVTEANVYRPATPDEVAAQDAERARREAEYAALPRMSMAEALKALATPAA
ncbi:hypothetical protein ACFVSX_32270 [Streptomyces rubiginosohelvolus]|uniref:hypothetical protein n=1 Tax=Streptomyces rubiginosohelvolus TaxID=67362 RepID=UPI0036DF9716